jgi:hypothetical protein
MTKEQKLEERIRRDDRMCAEINRVLDTHGYTDRELAETLGRIGACLIHADRRAASAGYGGVSYRTAQGRSGAGRLEEGIAGKR